MSSLTTRVRQSALNRVFGQGFGGFVAAAAVGWLVDQVREARQPQRLDTATLVPGETYLVTTRPGMNRAERRDAKKLAAAKGKLAKVTTPSRTTRTTARKLSSAQRKVATSAPDTRRHVRNERKVEVLAVKFDRLTAPTAQQRKLETQVAALSGRMETHRRQALAKSAKGHHPRTKVFR